MKQPYLYIILFLLLFFTIIFIYLNYAILPTKMNQSLFSTALTEYSNYGSETGGVLRSSIIEGATVPTPTDFPWDYDYLMNKNNSLQFNMNESDPNNVVTNNFINYLINQNVPYSKVEVPPVNPQFPEYGNGVCMTDWYNVKDTTNGVTGPRTVRMKNGEVLGKLVHPTDGKTAYNQCLEYAQEQKKTRPSINVFAIQYGVQCFVGDTNYIALNSNTTTTDYRTQNSNQVGKLSSPNVNYCQRPGYSSTNGSGWTQMVYAYPLPKTMYRFNDDAYSNKIKTYLDSGLNSYNSILNSIKLNFTTMEGFVTPKAVGIPITNLKENVGINQNIINKLKQKNFIVTEEEYQAWITQLVKSGVSVDKYLEYGTRFGIHSENDISKFLSNFKTLFNIPIKLPSIAIIIVTIILGYFRIKTIDNYNSFSELAIRYELNKVPSPLFLTMNVLKTINVYWTDYTSFFTVWQSNNISTKDTINIIINVLTDQTFNYQYNGNPAQLGELIQFVMYSGLDISSIQIPDPVTAFTTFKNTLKELNVTYSTYMSYYGKLQNVVGIQQKIMNILPTFKTYYDNVAYSDDPKHKFENPVTVNTIFNDFIYVIDPPGSTVPPYFTPCGADFNTFLTKITKAPFTVAKIIAHKHNYSSSNDTSTGETYCKFMEGGFEDFNTYYSTKDESDISSQIYTYIKNFLYNITPSVLFTKTKIEGATTAELKQSNSTLYQTFFQSENYDDKLDDLSEELKKRGLVGSDNIVLFVNSFVDANIYYADYSKICKVFDEFNDGVTIPINSLQEIISSLASIGITSSDGIIQFISNISKNFRVKYKKLNNLLDDMIRFNMGSKSVNISAVNQFILDMISIKAYYSNKNDIDKIQKIIAFFISMHISLGDYYYGQKSQNKINQFNNDNIKCDTISLPANFPSLFINSLNRYNKSTNSYRNELHDIINPPDLDVQRCDKIDAIQEVYMLTNGLQTYNERISVILTNITVIISFVYKEEMDAIINNSTSYNNIQLRISMMNDIANGMIRYSGTFKDRQDMIDLYNKIARFLKMYPVLSFQYISNEIMSKCNNSEECLYSYYVNPLYTECKASTVNSVINYRPNPPVL